MSRPLSHEELALAVPADRSAFRLRVAVLIACPLVLIGTFLAIVATS